MRGVSRIFGDLFWSPSFISRTETADGSIPVYLRVFQTVYNPGLLEILSAHLHFYDVADRDLNEMLSQLTGNVS